MGPGVDTRGVTQEGTKLGSLPSSSAGWTKVAPEGRWGSCLWVSAGDDMGPRVCL